MCEYVQGTPKFMVPMIFPAALSAGTADGPGRGRACCINDLLTNLQGPMEPASLLKLCLGGLCVYAEQRCRKMLTVGRNVVQRGSTKLCSEGREHSCQQRANSSKILAGLASH